MYTLHSYTASRPVAKKTEQSCSQRGTGNETSVDCVWKTVCRTIAVLTALNYSHTSFSLSFVSFTYISATAPQALEKPNSVPVSN